MKNYLKHILTAITMIVVSSIIVSCGGGGGSSGSTSTGPSNTNPGSAPTVTMSQPINNATKVSLTQPVILAFSEAVTNVSTSTVKVYENSIADGNVVPTENPTPGAGNTYTFRFRSNLNQDTTYYVVVGSGIKSVSSGKEVETTNFNFKTGTFANPTVSLVNPANESTNVPVNTLIQIQFSESVTNVNTATVTLYSGSESGTPVTVSSITPGAGNSYTLNLSGNLSYATDYYVELSSGITSADEGVPLQATTFHFKTTTQPAAPTVLMISPLNGSTIESLDPTIKIQFSESVTGVSPATIQLREGSESGALLNAIIIAGSNNIYSLTPFESLDAGKSYYVQINNGITSVNTGESVVPTSFNFSVTGTKFAYITYESGVNVCPVDFNTGAISSSCTLTISSKHAYKVSLNPSHTFAYVSSQHDNTVTVCTINQVDGTLSNCNAVSGFNGPTSVAFNSAGTYAYVTNSGGNNVFLCTVSQTTGTLAACAKTGNASLNKPIAIAIDATNSYAYIVNNGNNTMTLCNVAESNNSLQGCVATGTGFKSSKGITIGAKNQNLYTTSTSKITGCTISPNNGYLVCNDASGSIFTNLTDLALDGNNMYIADAGNGAISLCVPDPTGNSGGICNYTSLNNGGLLGITILANQ